MLLAHLGHTQFGFGPHVEGTEDKLRTPEGVLTLTRTGQGLGPGRDEEVGMWH